MEIVAAPGVGRGNAGRFRGRSVAPGGRRGIFGPLMDDFRSKNGELHCEETPVAAIADAVGTPTYVYSRHTLVDHFRRLRAAFAGVDPRIRYAVKANGNLALLKILAAEGAGFDVVSQGEIHRVLARTGDNVVGEILRDQGTFYEWDHFPPGDVYDRQTHSQYYYHAHPVDQRFDGEHGHFHTFMRPKGMPESVKPAPVPGFKPPKDPNDALSHLIAISMTPQGLPFRLFTVNRWVTGEVWYSAGDVASLLERFDIDQQTHQFGDGQCRMGIVELNGIFFRKAIKYRQAVGLVEHEPALFVAADDIL